MATFPALDKKNKFVLENIIEGVQMLQGITGKTENHAVLQGSDIEVPELTGVTADDLENLRVAILKITQFLKNGEL